MSVPQNCLRNTLVLHLGWVLEPAFDNGAQIQASGRNPEILKHGWRLSAFLGRIGSVLRLFLGVLLLCRLLVDVWEFILSALAADISKATVG